MKNRVAVWILGALGLFCTVGSGCMKTLDLPGGDGERKIVLMGEFIVGDTVHFRAGQSVPVSAGSDMTFRLPDALLLTIDDGVSTRTISGIEDSLSYRLHTLLCTAGGTIAPATTYTVTAVHPGMPAATALVQIPRPVDAVILDTATVIYNTDTVLRFRVRIRDDASKSNYYVFECLKQYMDVNAQFFYQGVWLPVSENRKLYNQQLAAGSLQERSDTSYYNRFFRKAVYTNDNNTENAYINGLTAQQSRILLSDRTFNGQEYTTDVYVQLSTSADSVHGLTLFYIKSVSADYFEFLKAYQQTDGASAFLSLSAPAKVGSYVTNGAGVIGGVSQIKVSYLFDTW